MRKDLIGQHAETTEVSPLILGVLEGLESEHKIYFNLKNVEFELCIAQFVNHVQLM